MVLFMGIFYRTNERFVEGDVYTVADMRDKHKSLLVADHLATWHSVDLPNESEPGLFPTMWKWLKVSKLI